MVQLEPLAAMERVEFAYHTNQQVPSTRETMKAPSLFLRILLTIASFCYFIYEQIIQLFSSSNIKQQTWFRGGQVKRIGIVGAGPAGLACAKVLSEMNYFDHITLFEKEDRIGGIWNNGLRKAKSPLYDELHTNISRYMMSFTDFPMPDDFPDFPSKEQVNEYLESYAKEFNLYSFIKFNTEIVSMKKIANKFHSEMSEDGKKYLDDEPKWEVQYKKEGDNSIQTEIFDAVIICQGKYGDGNIPSEFQKLQQIYKKGRVIHSIDFNRSKDFEGKCVVCVGVASSGAEIAAFISRNATKTYASVKKTALVLPKYVEGKPLDRIFRRSYLLPKSVQTYFVRNFMRKHLPRSPCFYPLASTVPPENTTTIGMSTEFLQYVGNGRIELIGKVLRVESDRLLFEKHGSDKGVWISPDYIVCCTGYGYDLPFVKEDSVRSKVIPDSSIMTHVYQHIFFMTHPSLSFVGLCQRLSPFPVFDLQAQWIGLVLSGKKPLPSQDKMISWEKCRQKEMSSLGFSARQWHVVNHAEYADYIAKEIGCYPDFFHWRNHHLFSFFLSHPVFPFQYRLEGPFAKRKLAESLLQKCIQGY